MATANPGRERSDDTNGSNRNTSSSRRRVDEQSMSRCRGSGLSRSPSRYAREHSRRIQGGREHACSLRGAFNGEVRSRLERAEMGAARWQELVRAGPSRGQKVVHRPASSFLGLPSSQTRKRRRNRPRTRAARGAGPTPTITTRTSAARSGARTLRCAKHQRDRPRAADRRPTARARRTKTR